MNNNVINYNYFVESQSLHHPKHLPPSFRSIQVFAPLLPCPPLRNWNFPPCNSFPVFVGFSIYLRSRPLPLFICYLLLLKPLLNNVIPPPGLPFSSPLPRCYSTFLPSITQNVFFQVFPLSIT